MVHKEQREEGLGEEEGFWGRHCCTTFLEEWCLQGSFLSLSLDRFMGTSQCFLSEHVWKVLKPSDTLLPFPMTWE